MEQTAKATVIKAFVFWGCPRTNCTGNPPFSEKRQVFTALIKQFSNSKRLRKINFIRPILIILSWAYVPHHISHGLRNRFMTDQIGLGIERGLVSIEDHQPGTVSDSLRGDRSGRVDH
jgi:hypothetical protein